MSFLLCAQKVQPLLYLLDEDTQELQAGNTLHLGSVATDGCECAGSSFPVVHNKLFGFQVQMLLFAPGHQTINLLPVGGLIIVSYLAYSRGVVCNFDDDVIIV